MAMILHAFVNRFSGLLLKLVEEKVTMLLDVDDEIDSLNIKLEMISSVLEDAERRRIDDRAIDRWLKRLRDVMYDADDILDLCRIEAEKYSSNSEESTRASTSSGSKARVRSSFPCQLSCLPLPTCFCHPAFAHDIGKRIKHLNFRLEKISNEKNQYGFLNLKHYNLHDEGRVSEVSDKTSSVAESDIVGTKIIEDTNKLVELLTRQDTRENILVFAIAGMGGIGKTTLAQLIFNDDVIKGHFQLKIWGSVSKSFNEDDLLRDMITSAEGDPSGAISRNQLETKLVDTVRGKKFMLVLDDVWDESLWDRLLRNTLSRGVAGSRVLVTSRTELVAMRMKAVYCHQVDVLPIEDGWSLLCKKLILGGGEGEIEHLKDIGIKIVEKCGGLPLAIKALGAVLCTKSRRDWESVLRSTAWSVSGLPEQVNRALYLSFLHLPSHLKQCFMYCFLLPKAKTIQMEKLVQLWIAEGFIKEQTEWSISMEETGEGYYRELIWRSLLQPHPRYYDINACSMHDLLRSLAGYLAQDESLLVEVQEGSSNKNNNSMKLRRLSVVGEEGHPDVLSSKESLRTLILFKNQSKQLNGVLNHLPFLRVLELYGSKIEELPDSLTCLKHLRYLGLEKTCITSLPKNIGNLKQLQFLNLRGCEELDRLPNSVVDLENLRSLDISFTGVEGMPAGIGSLRHLNSLQGYSLHSSEEAEGTITTTTTGKWSTLEDLGPLLQLRHLTLENLEMVSHSSEARAAALMNKSHLIQLFLCCTVDWIDEATVVDMKRTEEVFEALQPPSCVETLGIDGFPGSRFPNWMTTTMLSNLRDLDITAWEYCESLPPVGQLPNLTRLSIYALRAIQTIGPEFMGASCGNGGVGKGKHSSTFVAFPKLQELGFRDMPLWEEWQWSRELEAMPCLLSLDLSKCDALISLPEGLPCHAAALTKLVIRKCDCLESVEKIDSLQELEVANCFSLQSVSDLPKLKTLAVANCPFLNIVGNLDSLQLIELTDQQMDSLPEWLLEGDLSDQEMDGLPEPLSEDTDKYYAPEPVMLDIYCNQQLFEKLCQITMCEMGEEEWSKIRHISYVQIYCLDNDAHVSYTKDPFNFILTRDGSSLDQVILPDTSSADDWDDSDDDT